MRRFPRQGSVRLRGLDIHLQHWCRDSTTAEAPVVLLHGWQDTGSTYQFMIDGFHDDLPMVALDWRGFGRSEWAREGYWFADYFADLEALLDLLCPGEPVRLIGHSMGGNIASQYAGLRPERVRCLVSLEGFGLPREKPEAAPPRIVKWLTQVATRPQHKYYKSLAELTSIVRFRYPRFTAAQAAFVAASWSEPHADGIRLLGDPRHRWTSPMRFARDEVEACWRGVRAPLLMVLGEESEYVQQWDTAEIDAAVRQHIPHAQIARVAGGGHMVHIERAGEVARLAEDFLRTH